MSVPTRIRLTKRHCRMMAEWLRPRSDQDVGQVYAVVRSGYVSGVTINFLNIREDQLNTLESALEWLSGDIYLPTSVAGTARLGAFRAWRYRSAVDRLGELLP